LIVILVSDDDEAAINIRDSLLERTHWSPLDGPPTPDDGEHRPEGSRGWGPLHERLVGDGGNAWKHPSAECVMLMLKGSKLHWEDVDGEVKAVFTDTGLIIFPSRHRSESGLRTLTVHPTGNYKGADFGGTPGQLSMCAPAAQTAALRALKRRAAEAGLDHGVSFECTHHGPRVLTPHFFIEIGSDEDAWGEKPSGDVLAAAILDVVEDEGLVAGDPDTPAVDSVIGVGGGHYCPRFTEVALTKKCAVGHVMPNYAADCDDEAKRQAVDRTPGARYVYFHRKSMKGARYRELRDWFTSPEGGGLEEVRSRDMEDL